MSCFQDIVLANQFDVIALTETWLNNSVTNYEVIPNSYQIIQRDRQTGKRGGSVLLAMKDTIATEPFPFSCDSVELSSVVIKSFFKRVLVAVCYRPPDADNDFLQNLKIFMKSAIDSNIKILSCSVISTFLTSWINGSGFADSSNETIFTDMLQDNSLFQLVNLPTRGSSTLDLILTTNENLVENIEVTDDEAVSLQSDHKAIVFDLHLHRKPKKPSTKTVYNYNKGDFAALRTVCMVSVYNMED